MNFQANKKRNGFSSAQCDSGNNIKGVRRSVMSQRATNEIKAAICSARLKKLRFECFKDVDKRELYSPTHVGEKRKQSSIIQPSLSKRCEKQKPTSKKFQDFEVYKSFMEGQEGTDLKRSKNGETSEKKNPVKVTTRNTEGTTEAANPSRVKHPDHAIRRYALFRGMICQSRFEEDHKFKKDKSKSKDSYNRDKRKETNKGTTTVHDKNNKHKATQSRVHHEASSGNHVHETINVDSWNDDLRGTQFPKRIYIREISNGAIVDEIVDVQNERDWEVLNYMTPLRHITIKPHERSENLCFRELRDFDVYYYPHPWR